MSTERTHPFSDVKGVSEFFVMPILNGDQSLPQAEERKAIEIKTLGEWRTLFGGNEGKIRDPLTGTVYTVSLQPWNNLDGNTKLAFEFRFTPEQE